MPRIPDQVKNIAVYLFDSVENAKAGAWNASGTGFVYSVNSIAHPHLSYAYVVTNAHCVRNGITVVRINSFASEPAIFALDPADWFVHPDGYEIAVTCEPISFNRDVHDLTSINNASVYENKDREETDIGVGDDVFMIGRFIDKNNHAVNKPAARFGNISVMPSPIYHPGTKKTLPSYLIDMHSRTGFSGSPVFMYRTPGSNLEKDFKAGMVSLGDGQCMFFLGIHWGQYSEDLIFTMGADQGKIDGFSGMTLVDPAENIAELLRMERFVEQRKTYDANLMRRQLQKNEQDSSIRLESEPAISGDDILKVMLNTPPTPHKGGA